MFSFGSKVKQKLTATRFEFSFVLHSLSPWPEGARAIAIGYQRGKRRRGATRSVYPSRQPGRLGAVVRFNERFDMPVTLYKASSGHSANNGLGPFKKKCLILAVLETDGRTQATAALGRVVVDLSEYAAIEHQETRTFMVSCNKAIHATVGDPQLMVTIRCRWKKLAREGGAAAGVTAADETASMSTDTTGSRMTANLSSFLRFKFAGGRGGVPANEEQDLRGFEAAGPGGGSGGGANGTRGGSVAGDAGGGLSKVMDTIQESHDEPAEAPSGLHGGGGGGLTPGGSRSLTPATSAKGGLTPASSSVLGGAEHSPPPRSGDGAGPLEAGVMGMSLREAHAARRAAQGTASPSPRNDAAAAAMALRGADNYDRSRSGLTPAASALSLDAADHPLLAALRAELLTAAALEAALYLPRRPPGAGLPRDGPMGGASGPASVSGASATPPHGSSSGLVLAPAGGGVGGGERGVGGGGERGAPRTAHVPARRIARTVLCLGPADGPGFGAAALRVMRAQVASAGDGLDALSYWWSNAVHMRAMLSGLSLAAQLAPGAAAGAPGGGLGGLGGSEHWAAAALVPELRRLERAVFDELLGRLWERVLLPTVTGAGARAGGAGGGAGGKDAPAKPLPATKRAQQEAATKKWFEGLEAVCSALGRLGSGPVSAGGHTHLLRQQVLLQCLKRVDLLLLVHLLGGAEAGGVADLLSDYDPHGALAARGPGSAGGGAVPSLDDASLPFARGVLTFGGGMGVKMTVTRLQQWAAAQPIMGGGAPDADALACAGATDRGSAAGSGPTPPPLPLPPGGVGLAVGAQGPLFPLLRAAADLLMMPKELLLDRAVRLDVGAALSMRSVLHILERFQPDEFAQDSISPAILESLQHDAALPQMHLRTPAADVNGGYAPPPDAAALRGVEGGWEPGLEYDADSEEELEELAQVVARGSALSGGTPRPGAAPGAAIRFRLLHECWNAGMPRRRGAMSNASMQA